MRKSISGFTIVELLIVVVVIGILAAIVTVAYTGIQAKAKDTKTISAVKSWVKALRLYEVENGSLPTSNSCLGKTTTYDGNGQCYSTTYWVVKTPLLNLLSPYMTTQPEPDTSQIDSTNNPDWRGAFYNYWSAGDKHQIYMMLTGTSSCPSIGSETSAPGQWTGPQGIRCVYNLD